MSHQYPGVLVTLEGIDGAGKTSAMEAVRDSYWGVTTTAEPGGGSLEPVVRDAMHDDVDAPLRDFYLYQADRAEHLAETVVPALEAGNLVVCDRYTDSTRAYQSVALEGSVDGPFGFITSCHRAWPVPDLTIYLSVDVDTAMSRIDGGDRYEKREFLERVKQRYDYLSCRDRFSTVDTQGLDVEDTQARVIDEIEAYLNEVTPSEAP